MSAMTRTSKAFVAMLAAILLGLVGTTLVVGNTGEQNQELPLLYPSDRFEFIGARSALHVIDRQHGDIWRVSMDGRLIEPGHWLGRIELKPADAKRAGWEPSEKPLFRGPGK
jgi:hypothetical protein